MTDDGSDAATRRYTSPAAVPPTDVDDLLREILLRLPPRPSSLRRASHVCTRWRRVVSDPAFLRRFRARYRTAPLLGGFENNGRGVASFIPILDGPDRVPPERLFSLVIDAAGGPDCDSWRLLGCRHGRVLVVTLTPRREVVVCDPVTRDRRVVALPREFDGHNDDDEANFHGAVVCTAGDTEPGHVHGACHASPFKVVLVRTNHNLVALSGAVARVYSSETGLWGELIYTAYPCSDFVGASLSTLIGNTLYWWLIGSANAMLEFDLGKQTLAVVKRPRVSIFECGGCRIVKAPGGGVGLAVLLYPNFQLWDREVNSHGIATWVLRKTVDLQECMVKSRIKTGMGTILGYAEEENIIFIGVNHGTFMVRLDSMQSRRLYGNYTANSYHPFTSFYRLSA